MCETQKSHTPFLVNRRCPSNRRLRIFAEEPWVVSDTSPESIDHSLNFGAFPIFVDLSITDEIDFGLEKFTEVLPTLTDFLRKDFLIPAMKEPRMIEVDGLPCAVIQGSGIMLEGPEAFIGAIQVKQNYYILNGDRIIHFSSMGEQETWSQVEPIIENLVLNMKFPQVAPMLGPVPVLLNRSEDGFIVYARDPWNTTHDEVSDVWGLSRGDDPLALHFFVHKDVGSVSEQIQSSVQSALQSEALWFENPTFSEVSEIDVNGTTATTFEVYGTLKSEFATYPGEPEHYFSVFIPQENQFVRILISSKHDSWDEFRPMVFKLIRNIHFFTPDKGIVKYDPEASLLVDRAEVGYQIHANGLWQLEEEKEEVLDASIFSEALGCYISVTVVAGTIPPEDLAGNLENFHKSYLGEFLEPHSVNSGIIEIDGQRCAISEVYGVKAEGTNYAGIDLHERQIFLPKENHLVHFSIRTTTGNWENAEPHIEEVMKGFRFPDVP